MQAIFHRYHGPGRSKNQSETVARANRGTAQKVTKSSISSPMSGWPRSRPLRKWKSVQSIHQTYIAATPRAELVAHSGRPGIGIHRLPDAQIQIQLATRCSIVNRDRFTKASLECPLAGGCDLEAEATEELRQVLGHRGVAELDFDAVRTTSKLPQAGHLPRIEV